MAKTSMIWRDKHRAEKVRQLRARRDRLKAVIYNRDLAPEERFQATLKLAALPRSSSRTRMRNRCQLTGRPRGVYRKFRLCRNELRRLASLGKIPGMVKSSW